MDVSLKLLLSVFSKASCVESLSQKEVTQSHGEMLLMTLFVHVGLPLPELPLAFSLRWANEFFFRLRLV